MKKWIYKLDFSVKSNTFTYCTFRNIYYFFQWWIGSCILMLNCFLNRVKAWQEILHVGLESLFLTLCNRFWLLFWCKFCKIGMYLLGFPFPHLKTVGSNIFIIKILTIWGRNIWIFVSNFSNVVSSKRNFNLNKKCSSIGTPKLAWSGNRNFPLVF